MTATVSSDPKVLEVTHPPPQASCSWCLPPFGFKTCKDASDPAPSPAVWGHKARVMNFPRTAMLKESGKPLWLENAYLICWCPFLFRKDSPIHVIIKLREKTLSAGDNVQKTDTPWPLGPGVPGGRSSQHDPASLAPAVSPLVVLLLV